jgi:DNA-binding SARP family transcriptional activator
VSAVLDIRLLGSVELRVGATPVPPPESARAVSLLAYLLVHRGVPQPRRRLAFLLWPDSTEAQARTNLRKALHGLRRALPEGFLDGDAQTLRWRTDARYTLDLEAFEQARDPRAAVDASGGDLLAGHYDEWVLDERERLRDRYADALERLAAEPDGLAYAERLVRLDPLREAGTRAVMRLHAARGDRVRAMRAYHAYAALAQRELGIVPAPELRAAYEALLDDRPPAPSARVPPLIGRERERERLRAAWTAAARGHAQLALVTGEPGIGKSRLVEDLRATCGAPSAEARGYAAEGAIAYGPVVAWLRSPALSPRLRRLAPAHLAELARLLPELGAPPRTTAVPAATAPLGLGGRRPAAELSADERRTRLYAAIAETLIGSGAPLLLVADDLQHFDVPTLRFLHYLLRARAPVLVAATARREDLDAAHPAAGLATALQALGRCTEIALARLGRRESGRLAEQLRGAPLEPAHADRLFAASEGNPLYLVEAVQAGSAGGAGAGDDRGAPHNAHACGRGAGGCRGDDRPRVLGPGPGRRVRRPPARFRARPRRAVAARHRARARPRPLRLQPRPHP